MKNLSWFSLIEIGCGAGANLANIARNFNDRQLGGVDVNKDAIEVANKALTGAHLQVGRGDDVMMSDDSTDIVLSDMYLIYVGPRKIKEHLKEMRRLARKYVILCEFHSNSWWKRLYVRFKSGYHAHDYQITDRHGLLWDREIQANSRNVARRGLAGKGRIYIRSKSTKTKIKQ